MNIITEPTSGRGLVAPAPTAWGYVRHELLFLGYALMEVALLTPLVLVILGWARYWPAPLVALWLLLTMLLPLNLVRLLTLLHVSVGRQRRILIVALLIVVLLTWRGLLYAPNGLFDLSWLRQFGASLAEAGNLVWARDLSIFLIIVLVWYRGVRLAGRQPEIGNAGLRLRLGGLILMPLIVWLGGGFLSTSVVPFVLLFFLAALTTVALVRAEAVELEQRGTSSTLNARWFAVVAAAGLAIVLAGGVLAAFLAGDSLFTIVAWLSPLWRAIQFAATIVAAVLLELTYPLLEALAFVALVISRVLLAVLGQVSLALRSANILPQEAQPTTPAPAAGTGAFGGPQVDQSLAVLLMLGLIILVGFALARVYQQATAAARDSRPPERLADEDEPPGLGQRILERLGILRQWRAAASVRRIYRAMCRAAAAAGYPRLEAETPYEYLPTLAHIWPNDTTETRLITEAFIRVRYGEAPETEAEMMTIREAWRQLEASEPHRRETPAESGPFLARRD